MPMLFCREVVTASGLFGAFLRFAVPLLIPAFVSMGIAEMRQGTGKLPRNTRGPFDAACKVSGGNAVTVNIDRICNQRIKV